MTKVITKRSQRETLPFAARRWLMTGKTNFWFYLIRDQAPEDIWEMHGEAVTSYYARKYPGFRPRLWWQLTSPEPRRRLGGTGDLIQVTCPAIMLSHTFGIPTDWGAIDNADPPTFEAEASYLQRLDLLLPGELERLGKTAFEPRVVLMIGDRVRVQRLSAPRPDNLRHTSDLVEFFARHPILN